MFTFTVIFLLIDKLLPPSEVLHLRAPSISLPPLTFALRVETVRPDDDPPFVAVNAQGKTFLAAASFRFHASLQEHFSLLRNCNSCWLVQIRMKKVMKIVVVAHHEEMMMDEDDLEGNNTCCCCCCSVMQIASSFVVDVVDLEMHFLSPTGMVASSSSVEAEAVP